MSVSDLHKCATEVAHEDIQREHVTDRTGVMPC